MSLNASERARLARLENEHRATATVARTTRSLLTGTSGDLATHEADTMNIHGIADTAQLVTAAQLSAAIAGVSGGGGGPASYASIAKLGVD